jgi:hypothetical protein
VAVTEALCGLDSPIDKWIQAGHKKCHRYEGAERARRHDSYFHRAALRIACAQSTRVSSRRFQVAGSPADKTVESWQRGNDDRDCANRCGEHDDER